MNVSFLFCAGYTGDEEDGIEKRTRVENRAENRVDLCKHHSLGPRCVVTILVSCLL